MRLILLALLLSVSLISSAQSGLTVTYSRSFYPPILSPRAFVNTMRDRLQCDKDLSFFYVMGLSSDPHKKNKVVDLEGSFYYDYEKQLIYNVHVMPREIGTLLITDSLKAGNWIFLNKEKKFKGYDCKLAITINNNRDTTLVWYTEEVPFKAGPSRFIGFPGLVLEVIDPVGRVHYKATSIKERKEAVLLPPYKILTRKEYLESY